MLFLDLEKGFDTIGHHILLFKLSESRLAINVINWIANYLSNQFQGPKFRTHEYDTMMTTYGVHRYMSSLALDPN